MQKSCLSAHDFPIVLDDFWSSKIDDFGMFLEGGLLFWFFLVFICRLPVSLSLSLSLSLLKSEAKHFVEFAPSGTNHVY